MTSYESEIVISNPGDREQGDVRALWAHAFPEDSDAFADWYFREMYQPGNTRGLYEDGRSRSFLQMNPYTQRIRGRDMPVAAIAGVSTWTEHRRRGFAARLLRDSLEVLRARGVAAAFLYPFDYSFYRAYGYEVIMDRRHFTLKPTALCPPGDGGSAVAVGEERADELAAVYRRFMGRYSGYIIRDRQSMARRLREHRSEYEDAHGWQRGGRLCGYALHHREDDAVVIDEWAADDEAAFIGLLGQACRGGLVGGIRWIGPADDPFPMNRLDARSRPEPFTMARIVDLAEFVGGAPCRDEVPPVCCAVTDESCGWNRGIWRIGARGGSFYLEPGQEPVDLIVDISLLGPLIMGSPGAAGSVGPCGDRIRERLSVLFPPLSLFMWEMY